MPFTVVSGPTILAGQSLSDAIDCRNGTPIRLIFPVLWTPANVSFQVSYDDGVSYTDLFDLFGHEAMIAGVPGAVMPIGTENGLENQFLKLRSGSRIYPIVQAVDRTFQIVLSA